MTDLNQLIAQKAAGQNRLKPDEQRTFLETFEERVIALCTIEIANLFSMQEHFRKILSTILEDYPSAIVKISPNVNSSYQMIYLKIAKDLKCQATIVSNECAHSPYGLVIHSNVSVNVAEKDITKQFSQFFKERTHQSDEPKMPFWKKWFS